VHDALVAYQLAIAANITATLDFNRFGGVFIKAARCSPDAFVQVAMQLTMFQLYGVGKCTSY
jgi:hypothetical protein